MLEKYIKVFDFSHSVIKTNIQNNNGTLVKYTRTVQLDISISFKCVFNNY